MSKEAVNLKSFSLIICKLVIRKKPVNLQNFNKKVVFIVLIQSPTLQYMNQQGDFEATCKTSIRTRIPQNRKTTFRLKLGLLNSIQDFQNQVRTFRIKLGLLGFPIPQFYSCHCICNNNNIIEYPKSRIIDKENRIYIRVEFTRKKCKTAILLYCFHVAGVLHIFVLYNLLGPGTSFYRRSN